MYVHVCSHAPYIICFFSSCPLADDPRCKRPLVHIICNFRRCPLCGDFVGMVLWILTLQEEVRCTTLLHVCAEKEKSDAAASADTPAKPTGLLENHCLKLRNMSAHISPQGSKQACESDMKGPLPDWNVCIGACSPSMYNMEGLCALFESLARQSQPRMEQPWRVFAALFESLATQNQPCMGQIWRVFVALLESLARQNQPCMNQMRRGLLPSFASAHNYHQYGLCAFSGYPLLRTAYPVRRSCTSAKSLATLICLMRASCLMRPISVKPPEAWAICNMTEAC